MTLFWLTQLLCIARDARSSMRTKKSAVCRFQTGKWQLKRAAATPIFWLFQGLNKKNFENQTKTGRLAAISNFCLILFISSKNSFCKTVCFLGPNPKFNFMRSLQFFQRSQQKRLSNSTVLEQFQIKLFNYLFIHCHIVKNFDLEKNGAEFISRNENSKKVLGNPQ